MKLEQLKCPNCGGSIVLKDNDIWVCSSCRSIYKEEKDTSVDDKIKLSKAKSEILIPIISLIASMVMLFGFMVYTAIMK